MENKEKTQLKKNVYILPILFFVFIVSFAVLDIFCPDMLKSTLNDYPLQQTPTITAETLLDGNWTQSYTNYTNAQFAGNDMYLQLHSMISDVSGRLERNDIWLAQDGYLIAKNDTLSVTQQSKLPMNISAVAELTQRFSGNVSVMIVPSPANILADKLLFNPPQIDENAILDDMFAQFTAAGANVIDLRDTFTKAQQETNNVFYRTDHHWTTTGGAYLAYEEFCKSVGIAAVTPPSNLLVNIGGFLGTNYTKTLQHNVNADVLQYYNLPNKLSIYLAQDTGAVLQDETTIMNEARLSEYDKYAAFIHGNNGYSEIAGDGTGSILVIKDSFGNSFVPYLAANYETVGIMDLRSWWDVDSFIEEKGYTDILILYSFNAFTSDMFLYRVMDNMQ